MTTYVAEDVLRATPPNGGPARPTRVRRTRRRAKRTHAANVDQVLDASFPASDPPSWTGAISRVAATSTRPINETVVQSRSG